MGEGEQREDSGEWQQYKGELCKRNNNLRWFTIYRREIDKQLEGRLRQAV